MARWRGCLIALAFSSCAMSSAMAHDWPRWGGANDVQMVSDEKGIPETFEPKMKPDGARPAATNPATLPAPGRRNPGATVKEFDLAAGSNIKWIANLGTETYGNVTVAGGKVFVGTNNARPRDPKYREDRSVYMCFDEPTGKLLWQLAVPKMPLQRGPANMDHGRLGMCGSPTVEGEHCYVVTNRSEVLCLDVNGMADGNDGPYCDEAKLYTTPEYKLNPEIIVNGNVAKMPPGVKPVFEMTWPGKLVTLSPTDADVIWRFDMLNEIPTWQQDAASCNVLIRGDVLFTSTCMGVDRSHRNLPAGNAPCLIALDKRTGKLLAADNAGIGPRTLHGSWSSPSLITANGREMLVFGGPDGVCYALDPEVKKNGDKPGTIELLWKYDCSPPGARFKTRQDARYPRPDGPSECIGTPVLYKNRLYVTVGQDPAHGKGKTAMSCIDPTLSGDVTDKATIWKYTNINRCLSTPAIAEDLCFVGDLAGTVHCLDATTGAAHWTEELGGEIWSSAFIVDGKVFIGSKAGVLYCFALSKEKKILSRTRMGGPILTTPIVANGVLYVATHTHLFAISNSR